MKDNFRIKEELFRIHLSSIHITKLSIEDIVGNYSYLGINVSVDSNLSRDDELNKKIRSGNPLIVDIYRQNLEGLYLLDDNHYERIFRGIVNCNSIGYPINEKMLYSFKIVKILD